MNIVLNKNDKDYMQCTVTVMDNIADPDIRFDEKDRKKMQQLVAKIKKESAGKPYDCLIGVSGGVAIIYVSWLVKDLGLRLLAVHLDNGLHSELAVKNIENIISKLNIDLFTLVINQEELKSKLYNQIHA